MLTPSGIVYESSYYRVEVVAIHKVVKVTRLARPFESREALNAACEPVQETLDAVGRRTHFLLIDTRMAIGKNDPEYELWFESHRRRMLRGFRRAALIAKTAIGKLHCDRLLAGERPTPVFLDEEQALHFLLSEE
jgi:hypothetical protein